MKEQLLSDKGLSRLVDNIKRLSSATNDDEFRLTQAEKVDWDRLVANQQLSEALAEREQQNREKAQRRLIHQLKVFIKRAVRKRADRVC